jgi:hypothetical protein
VALAEGGLVVPAAHWAKKVPDIIEKLTMLDSEREIRNL